MSQDIPHHDQPTPDIAPSFSGRTMLWIIKKWKDLYLFVCSKTFVSKISQKDRFEICEKSKMT